MGFKIFIPARKGSKGFKNKNRKLLDYTLITAQQFVKNKNIPIIVDTDDDYIIKKASEYDVYVTKRSKRLADDYTSMRDVLLNNPMLTKNDTVIMLYLTYPYRKIEHIKKAVREFKRKKAKSLLCIEEITTHPYLCVVKINGKYRPLIQHDLYRRQDYPEIFEISHYVFIAQVSEIERLGPNLYNDNTFYLKINRVTDVDFEEDLK